jgi:hypothetical protein
MRYDRTLYPRAYEVAGKIRGLIDQLIQLRAGGRSDRLHFVRAHLALNGIDPDGFGPESDDDPMLEHQLQTMIESFKRTR